MRRAGPSTLASAALVNFAVAHWRPRRPPSSMSELHNSPEPTAYNYRVVRQFTLTPRLRGREQMHSFGLINAPSGWPPSVPCSTSPRCGSTASPRG